MPGQGAVALWLGIHYSNYSCKQALVRLKDFVETLKELGSTDDDRIFASLKSTLSDSSETLTMARAIFIETILHLALTSVKGTSINNAKSLVKDMLGDLATAKDGVMESDIQATMLSAAKDLLG